MMIRVVHIQLDVRDSYWRVLLSKALAVEYCPLLLASIYLQIEVRALLSTGYRSLRLRP